MKRVEDYGDRDERSAMDEDAVYIICIPELDVEKEKRFDHSSLFLLCTR